MSVKNCTFHNCVFVTANGGGSKSEVTLKSIVKKCRKKLNKFIKNFYIFKNCRYL